MRKTELQVVTCLTMYRQKVVDWKLKQISLSLESAVSPLVGWCFSLMKEDTFRDM